MPKINFLSLILLLSIATFLPSCGDDDKDDDNSGTPSNSFVYDGNTYTMVNGLIEDLGANIGDSFDFDVFLISDGITPQLTGTGDMLYLDLNTGLETGLEAGTYNWSEERDPFTIVDGFALYTNFNVETFMGGVVSITGGTVIVAIDGTEVTITANLDASGSAITGTYKGALTSF